MSAPRFQRRNLCRAWVHSHEEDTASEFVFRPATYCFPPARGRRALALGADGSYRDSVPGADDRGVLGEGTWELGEGGELILRAGAGGGGVRVWEVVAVDRERLVVKRG